MNAGQFQIVSVDYVRDLQKLRAIRDAVFVREQSVPLALEWDEIDPQCRHVLALDSNGMAIGTGRLTPQQTIGRMAVLPAWRGKGVGDALLRQLIAMAQQAGWPSVSLHAQLEAIGFYHKHGFVTEGEIYTEAGILHQSMRLTWEIAGN
jgi:predicted GNAT family N-acyltransferase